MQSPLDGRAPAKLLQDGPDVVQVAGHSSPTVRAMPCGGREAGSPTWGGRIRPASHLGVWKLRPRKGGDLSEVTGHLPPIPMLFRTCNSEPNLVGGHLFMRAGGGVGQEGEVTPWRPVTPSSPTPTSEQPCPRGGNEGPGSRCATMKRTQL